MGLEWDLSLLVNCPLNGVKKSSTDKLDCWGFNAEIFIHLVKL